MNEHLLPDEREMLERANAASRDWQFRDGTDSSGDSCELLVSPLYDEDPEFDQEYGQVLFYDGGLSSDQIEKNWEFALHSRTDVPELLRRLAEARRALREAQSGKEGK